MHLHTTPQAIDSVFINLLGRYKKFSWLAAWAGVGFNVYNAFIKNIRKAEKVVIGTHFYQTHPDFIEKTMGFNTVRFVAATDGVFHPKMFLFYNSPDDWSLLTGSANFTRNAFSKNCEVLLEISSSEATSTIFNDAVQFIDDNWKMSKSFDEQKFKQYCYERNRKLFAQRLLSDTDNIENEHNDLTAFQHKNWPEYVKSYIDSKKYRDKLVRRITLLEQIKALLDNRSFGMLTHEERLFIAGASRYGRPEFNLWADFGTTSRVEGYFKELDLKKSALIRAFDAIPYSGAVSYSDFEDFVRNFTKRYAATSITAASRLLAMKRPDVFYCYTSANRDLFARKFEIAPTTVNLNNYWERVVLKIANSKWYSEVEPQNSLEGQIVFGRAALLDAQCYKG